MNVITGRYEDITSITDSNSPHTTDIDVPVPQSDATNVSKFLPSSDPIHMRPHKRLSQMRQDWADLLDNYNKTKIEMTSMASTLYNNKYNFSVDDVRTPFFKEYLYGRGDQSVLLSSMYQMAGYHGPALNNVGSMTISLQSGNLSGMLMSDSQPPGGNWTVGETYDPLNMSGNQYMMVDGKMQNLTSPFTISSIQGLNGQDLPTVETVDRSLNTSSIEGYLSTMERIQQLYAESQAREEDAEAGGGFPDVGGWFNGLAQLAQVILIGILLLVIAAILT